MRENCGKPILPNWEKMQTDAKKKPTPVSPPPCKLCLQRLELVAPSIFKLLQEKNRGRIEDINYSPTLSKSLDALSSIIFIKCTIRPRHKYSGTFSKWSKPSLPLCPSVSCASSSSWRCFSCCRSRQAFLNGPFVQKRDQGVASKRIQKPPFLSRKFPPFGTRVFWLDPRPTTYHPSHGEPICRFLS